MKKIIKCYGYLRVSGTGQILKGGFDRQEKIIKSFVRGTNYKIEDIFLEKGVSGTKRTIDRPQFEVMVAAILSNGVRTIIVERLDRLAREYRIQEEILIYLASKGIDLISADTGENVTEEINKDPMKRAIIQIQGVFAELDKSIVVKKLRIGRQRKKLKTGKCEGRKRFGEDNEAEKNIVKKIIYLRRKDRGQLKQMSFRKIANKLNDEGIETKTKKSWTAMTVYNVLNRKYVSK